MEEAVNPDRARLSRRSALVRTWQSAIAIASAPAVLAVQADTSWQPQFLTRERAETLAAISDRIVPGSRAAQCYRVIDLAMTIETPEVGNQLIKSIQAFEDAAHTKYSKAFTELSPEQQDTVIASLAEQSAPDSPFTILKEWTADAYWSSREGLRELGWNGQMAWSGIQACASQGTA